jgi:ABC-2 type transport system ATP-binding protein
MIELSGLTKRYGSKLAVDDLSFDVADGKVTGFLGPNGAGKSTTMRMILGLDRPTDGSSTINGKHLSDMPLAMREVGALLDAGYVHPTRKAYDHLWALAASNRISKQRVDEVIALVGLGDAANRRVGQFSLGMRQRLGLAGSLLGDPATLLFDEPANGLDPEGVHWLRGFFKSLASEGRTVLVSSHLLSEMQLMADDLVVIGQGRLLFDGSAAEFMTQSARHWVRVRSPQVRSLAESLQQQGAHVTPIVPDAMDVSGKTTEEIGDLAARLGLVLHELSPQSSSLEEAFLELTAGSQEYRTGALGAPSPPPPSTAGAPPPPPPPPPPPAGGDQ